MDPDTSVFHHKCDFLILEKKQLLTAEQMYISRTLH